VYHGGVELARGNGRSKKLAESAAALVALQKIKAGEIRVSTGASTAASA
jgi:dsRNA-specific ribonuclease